MQYICSIHIHEQNKYMCFVDIHRYSHIDLLNILILKTNGNKQDESKQTYGEKNDAASLLKNRHKHELSETFKNYFTFTEKSHTVLSYISLVMINT